MDSTDAILLITSASIVGVFLAPLASRMIARAAADLSAEVDPAEQDRDLSRIRTRSR